MTLTLKCLQTMPSFCRQSDENCPQIIEFITETLTNPFNSSSVDEFFPTDDAARDPVLQFEKFGVICHRFIELSFEILEPEVLLERQIDFSYIISNQGGFLGKMIPDIGVNIHAIIRKVQVMEKQESSSNNIYSSRMSNISSTQCCDSIGRASSVPTNISVII